MITLKRPDKKLGNSYLKVNRPDLSLFVPVNGIQPYPCTVVALPNISLGSGLTCSVVVS